MRKSICGLLVLGLYSAVIFAQATWTSPFLNTSTDEPSLSKRPAISSFTGTPTRILITRPVTKYGNAPLEDKWLLLLCEYYLYFRLRGIEAVSVVPQDALVELVPEYMEYKMPIPIEKYGAAAKKVSADYLIYIQCEYNRLLSEGQISLRKDTDINFFGKIVSPSSDKPLFVDAKQFSVDKLGMRLDMFLNQVFEVLNIGLTEKNRNFMETAVMGSNGKKIKKLGEYLAAAYASEVTEWSPFIKKYKRLMRRNADMLIGYYAGAHMCEMAGKYLDAAHLFHSLIDALDMSYPRAFVETCRYYRLSGKFDQVEKIIGAMPTVEHLKHDVTMEKAFLLESKGEVRKAADMALDVLKEDKNNKRAREFYKQNTYEYVSE